MSKASKSKGIGLSDSFSLTSLRSTRARSIMSPGWDVLDLEQRDLRAMDGSRVQSCLAGMRLAIVLAIGPDEIFYPAIMTPWKHS